MIYTLLLRPSLHFTSSHSNFTQRQFTTLHHTSLHCTFRRFSPHFYSFHFTPFIISFLTLFLKILGLQGKVPNAGSWFQFFMVLFTKEYFPISALCFLSPISEHGQPYSNRSPSQSVAYSFPRPLPTVRLKKCV